MWRLSIAPTKREKTSIFLNQFIALANSDTVTVYFTESLKFSKTNQGTSMNAMTTMMIFRAS